ncbi:MAG: YfhO family protein, partial [Oscillospiraceae bacterium]|nr:YfhO family protein [Oscillospiraceae bacterium]
IFKNSNYIPMGFTYDYYMNINDIDGVDNEDVTLGDSGELINNETLSDKEKLRREKLLLKAIWLDDEQIAKYGGMMEKLPQELAEDISDETAFSDCEKRRSSSAYEFMPDKTGFTSRIDTAKDTLVFYSVPYDDGFKAYVDGQRTDIEKVFGGLSAVYVPAGEHEIRFEYHSAGLKESIIISIATAAVTVIYGIASAVINRKNGNMSVQKSSG